MNSFDAKPKTSPEEEIFNKAIENANNLFTKGLASQVIKTVWDNLTWQQRKTLYNNLGGSFYLILGGIKEPVEKKSGIVESAICKLSFRETSGEEIRLAIKNLEENCVD